MADTVCPACGEQSSVTFTLEEERFPYGIAPHTVELATMMDKGRCAACTLEFTDWRAEEAHDRAVQIYLADHKDLP
jgi:C4-type Zn-finger protein